MSDRARRIGRLVDLRIAQEKKIEIDILAIDAVLKEQEAEMNALESRIRENSKTDVVLFGTPAHLSKEVIRKEVFRGRVEALIGTVQVERDKKQKQKDALLLRLSQARIERKKIERILEKARKAERATRARKEQLVTDEMARNQFFRRSSERGSDPWS